MTPARKHDVEDIVATLRKMERLTRDGMSVSAAAKSLGITDQTFYRWRARYGSLPEDGAKRLQVLDEENVRLKRVIAEQTQDISMLQDLTQGEIPGAARRRAAVEYLVQQYHVSERRACRLVGQHRSTQRYGATARHENGSTHAPAGEGWSPAEADEEAGTATGEFGFQGWRGAAKEERGWQGEDAGRLEPGAFEGPGDEAIGPFPSVPKIPFLDDRIPVLYQLRTSLVHDVVWLTRHSELARLIGTSSIVRRLEGRAVAANGLVQSSRGPEVDARD